MFIVTPRRNPFRMNHDVRFLSHSSSILFLICVAVVAWMASQDAKVDLKPLIVAVILIYIIFQKQ
jgi:hypothetical protein